jgi:hypothetical protein
MEYDNIGLNSIIKGFSLTTGAFLSKSGRETSAPKKICHENLSVESSLFAKRERGALLEM